MAGMGVGHVRECVFKNGSKSGEMEVCLKMVRSLIHVSSVRIEPNQTNPVSSFADADSPALHFLPMLEDLLACEAVVLLQMCCFLAAWIPASQPPRLSRFSSVPVWLCQRR